MAKITFTIDTNEKTISGDVDGKALPNLDSISAYKSTYDGSLDVSCCSYDDNGSSSVMTSYRFFPDPEDDKAESAIAKAGFKPTKFDGLGDFLKKKMVY